jgi:hypothetical protein
VTILLIEQNMRLAEAWLMRSHHGQGAHGIAQRRPEAVSRGGSGDTQPVSDRLNA